jgi:hypothetical protein
VFARLANGTLAPTRIISGVSTRLGRTTHGIAYDEANDEIVAPNPLAAAVVVFRGGAEGDEAPIRTIQGAHSGLSRPETVAVDTVHNELFVGDPGNRNVLVYRRDADGDTRPIRVIQGERTGMHQIVGVAVDPIRDLLVVSSYSRTGGVTGLLVFNRTDHGDVSPRATIAGPRTGIVRLRQIALDPGSGKVFVAAINNEYLPPYANTMLREGLKPDIELPSPWFAGADGFIGIWDVTDNGDVPPRAVVKGLGTGIVHPAGVTFNPKHGEVIAPDSVWNGLFTFFRPDVFRPRVDVPTARR